MKSGPLLRILTGPTASGKTALALEWASKNNGWILSCDALLFYRGADIGTAKPSQQEQKRIPHFGIDLHPPEKPFDLPSYVKYAQSVLLDAEKKNVPVLVAGGSGFYLSAFSDAPPDPIQIRPEIKREVQTLAEEGGTAGLRKRLLEIDPDTKVDLLNPRRIAPALERCLTTGLTTEELRKRRESLECAFQRWDRAWFEIQPEEESLESNIVQRTQNMLNDGLLQEVERLRAERFEENPTLCRAIGYRETLEVLDGSLDESDLAKTITTNTLRLARQQKKWIRKRLPQTRPAEELLME